MSSSDLAGNISSSSAEVARSSASALASDILSSESVAQYAMDPSNNSDVPPGGVAGGGASPGGESSGDNNRTTIIVVVVLVVLAVIGLSVATFVYIYRRRRAREQAARMNVNASKGAGRLMGFEHNRTSMRQQPNGVHVEHGPPCHALQVMDSKDEEAAGPYEPSPYHVNSRVTYVP